MNGGGRGGDRRRRQQRRSGDDARRLANEVSGLLGPRMISKRPITRDGQLLEYLCCPRSLGAVGCRLCEIAAAAKQKGPPPCCQLCRRSIPNRIRVSPAWKWVRNVDDDGAGCGETRGGMDGEAGVVGQRGLALFEMQEGRAEGLRRNLFNVSTE
ncbi:hypothetical protein GWI33_002547 [Rhynchophorus ferrugineus]|uniref:Uncharacterized protein n=1 Tax=Rhynchophorus ferrugineus TaxID=354439 RepID=A0A834IVT0_RHYFE|nr:hypothetical protein GWI33_002547 [Rhynchophorus ferrugineus]